MATAAVGTADYFNVTNETWAKKGPPKEAWANTGKLGKSIEKDMSWQGDVTAKQPIWSGLSGMAGSNYAEAYANAVPATNEQYQFPMRVLKIVVRFKERLLAALRNGTATREMIAAYKREMQNAMSSLLRVLSYQVWGDGTGRIAKGDGGGWIATNVITLLNRKDALKFEKGDRLVFVDQGAAVPSGGQPTPRAFAAAPNSFLQVTKVDRKNGTLTTDKAVTTAIPTAVSTDFISKTVFFDDEYGILDGIFRVIARKDSDVGTVFNVDQTTDPTRLAGSRVLTTIGESPYDVIGNMLETAADLIDPDSPDAKWCIYTPTSVLKRLVAEMKANGIIYRDVNVASDRGKLIMGYKETVAQWPDFGEIAFKADKFFTDPTVSADQDETYLFLNERNLKIFMTPDGIGYKKFEDGGGFLKQIPGLQEYYAQCGFWGQQILDGFNEWIVASPTSNQ